MPSACSDDLPALDDLLDVTPTGRGQPREPGEHVDVIEMRIAVPKGVLTEPDLPGLQEALLAAAQHYLQGRRGPGSEE